MAKRFTDTEKWKKGFIKGLKPKFKLLWFYLLDDCNHAGIWEVDLKVAGMRIGARITYEEALEAMGSQIQVIGKTRWWVKDFVKFQYGELSPKNNLHKSVIQILNNHNLKVNQPLISPSSGAKEKGTDKEQDKVKEEGGVGENSGSDSKYEFKPGGDETLADFEQWTADVISDNDVLFPQMVKGLNLNGQLERLARDHLGKSARYEWHKKATTQQAFRHSLINFIVENLNKTDNSKQTPKKKLDLSGI